MSSNNILELQEFLESKDICSLILRNYSFSKSDLQDKNRSNIAPTATLRAPEQRGVTFEVQKRSISVP